MEILHMGDNMRKKRKSYLCLFFLFLSLFLLSGCGNKKEEELLKNKLSSEIEYLDSMLSSMLNKANGLTLTNYQVSAKKIEDKEQGNSNNENSSSSNEKSGSTGEGGNQEGSGQQGSSGDSSNSSKEDESEKNNYEYKMVQNSILTADKTPDWEELTSKVELIYSDWAVITLDLYKQNVDNQKILSFNTDLDALVKAIKEKNKGQTLTLLARLYSYLPVYYAGFSNDTKQTNLYKVKSSVLNAYAIIEQNNVEEVKKQLQTAEDAMIAMINNVSDKSQNEYNLNKAYILLKDLQNTIDKNDADVFYLKYKNLIEELDAL